MKLDLDEKYLPVKYPAWNVRRWNLTSGGEQDAEPTYADISETREAQIDDRKPIPRRCTRSLRTLEEFQKAVGTNYTNELAVLSIDRLFLHYIISRLVCNYQIHSKEDLLKKIDQVYTEGIATAQRDFAPDKERITRTLRPFRHYCIAYWMKGGPPDTGMPSPGLLAGEEQNTMLEKHLLEFMDNAFKAVSRPEYVPGEISPRYKEFEDQADPKLREELMKYYGSIKEKIFASICCDELERYLNAEVAKEAAIKAVNHAHQHHKGAYVYLDHHLAANRKNVIIAGGLATGKSYYIERQKGRGDLVRYHYAFVDLDEFKECDLISDCNYEKRLPGEQNKWNRRAHDECYLIREKILDELHEKALRGSCPNILLQTSVISERVYKVLGAGGAKVDAHLFYCDPDISVENSYQRQTHHKGRRTSTYVVLDSLKNTVRSLDTILREFRPAENEQPPEARHLLHKESLSRFSGVDEKKNSHHNPILTVTVHNHCPLFRGTGKSKENLIFVKKPDDGPKRGEISIYDLKKLRDMHKCLDIDPEANCPEKCFTKEEPELTLRANVEIAKLLKPYPVKFFTPIGHKTGRLTVNYGKPQLTAAKFASGKKIMYDPSRDTSHFGDLASEVFNYNNVCPGIPYNIPSFKFTHQRELRAEQGQLSIEGEYPSSLTKQHPRQGWLGETTRSTIRKPRKSDDDDDGKGGGGNRAGGGPRKR